MKNKWLAVLLAILVAPIVWGRTLGDKAPQSSLGSRGDVGIDGVLVSIPGLAGSSRVTYSVVVANDDPSATLLVATDVASAGPTTIATPANDISTMTKVIPVNAGERLVLDQGAQYVGLRAETTTLTARLIVTRR